MKKIDMIELENVNGGRIAQNPNGACNTDDKYLIPNLDISTLSS